MEPSKQATYKTGLLEMRRRLVHDVEAAEQALREDVIVPGELSSVPTHPADQGSEGLDAEIAIAQNEEHMLEAVEAALERIEAGTYGTCQQCGREIGTERLDAIPYTAECIDCARKKPNDVEAPPRGQPRRMK